MKPELIKKSLDKVGDPTVLVNVISRRVRQLTSAGGAGSRPLILETAAMGVADIALTEIIEDKMSWTLPEEEPPGEDPSGRRRRKSA